MKHGTHSMYVRGCRCDPCRDAARVATRDYLDRRKLAIRLAKEKPCADCGIQYPYYVMQFDHVRGEKEFVIHRANAGRIGFRRLQLELAKCDVVCANCHAVRTYRRAH